MLLLTSITATKTLRVAAMLCLTVYGAASAAEREFYIQAIEHKGKTNVSSEPFPSQPLKHSAGMKVKTPKPDGTWGVEAYGFSPAQITVMQNDEVVLHFVGINGAHHHISIEGVKPFEVTRGTTTTVRFVADKPGLIQMNCSDHQPSMSGQILVLPN